MNLDTFVRGMGLFAYHASLVGDAGRLAAYAKGIAEVVEEGDVVLDVGTGTGVLALLACCAGARRVYAVEQGPAVELARVVARGSRFGDRIVLIDKPSASIELPEQVDVIVTETLWNFGLGERMLGAIVDARDRFLKPGGAIVPRSLHLFAALVNSEALYGRFVDVWSARRDGVDLSALRPYAANNVYSAHLTDADLASAAAPLLDVSLLDSSSVDVEAQATVEVLRAGPIHGLGGWFRADLSDTASLSNAPPLATSNWLHAFLPFDRPLEPGAGTKVTITVATLGDGSHWRWQIECGDRSAAQASILGLPLAAEKLRRRAGSLVPEASRRSEAAEFVIAAFDGRRTTAEIGEEVSAHYGDLFPSDLEARAFVREVVAVCGVDGA